MAGDLAGRCAAERVKRAVYLGGDGSVRLWKDAYGGSSPLGVPVTLWGRAGWYQMLRLGEVGNRLVGPDVARADEAIRIDSAGRVVESRSARGLDYSLPTLPGLEVYIMPNQQFYGLRTTDNRYGNHPHDFMCGGAWVLPREATSWAWTWINSRVSARAPTDAGNRKTTDGKVPMALLPLDTLAGVAKVLDHGKLKYPGIDNWREPLPQGDTVRHYVSAALRHLAACQVDPKAVDKDSGLPHIDHAVTSLLIASHHTQKGSK